MFATPNYAFPATIVRVVDGDTYEVQVDCGFSTFRRVKVRLAGVNCPETSEAKGADATRFAEAWFASNPDFYVITMKTKGGDDKRSFVRYVATIHAQHSFLADEIVRSGHGHRV
jgi:micrococcal nuclease